LPQYRANLPQKQADNGLFIYYRPYSFAKTKILCDFELGAEYAGKPIFEFGAEYAGKPIFEFGAEYGGKPIS